LEDYRELARSTATDATALLREVDRWHKREKARTEAAKKAGSKPQAK
jgi:hypothetical protein